MAASAHLLFVLVAGLAQAERAQTALELALATHLSGAAQVIEVLLLGPGCDHVDGESAVNTLLVQSIDAGVSVAACTRSLMERQLVDAARSLGIPAVGAPIHLPSRVAEGAAVLVF